MKKSINKKRLNLGCGKDIRKGWINLDFIKNDGVDVIHDLNEYPLPFEDNTFDEVIAINLMEHLDKPANFVKELWRISKPNAKVEIETPHFSSAVAWQDITHVRPFSLLTMVHYDEKYLGSKSLLNANGNVRFSVDASPIMFRGYRWIGLNILAKKYPMFYEKFMAYLFQISGVNFKLKVIKH